MQEYRSNSHKSRQEQEEARQEKREKRVSTVVTGKVTTRENNGRKLANIFISEDAANVKNYVFMDVLVPAIKKAISDIVRDGIDMILYGDTGRSRGNGGRSRSIDRVSYREYYDDRRDGARRVERNDPNSRFTYDDLLFDEKGDAVLLLNEMKYTLKRYGIVTVADMYDIAELTAPHTASNYGWSSLRTAEVRRVRDKYMVDLPKAAPIEF